MGGGGSSHSHYFVWICCTSIFDGQKWSVEHSSIFAIRACSRSFCGGWLYKEYLIKFELLGIILFILRLSITNIKSKGCYYEKNIIV